MQIIMKGDFMRKIILSVISVFFIMLVFLSARKNDFAQLSINRSECNGMMNAIYCDVIIEKLVGDSFLYFDFKNDDLEKSYVYKTLKVVIRKVFLKK